MAGSRHEVGESQRASADDMHVAGEPRADLVARLQIVGEAGQQIVDGRVVVGLGLLVAHGVSFGCGGVVGSSTIGGSRGVAWRRPHTHGDFAPHEVQYQPSQLPLMGMGHAVMACPSSLVSTRGSMPRPEIDIVALNVRKNELLLLEVKSFLDSYAVNYYEIIGEDKDAKKYDRYKLLTNGKFREIVTAQSAKKFSSIEN